MSAKGFVAVAHHVGEMEKWNPQLKSETKNFSRWKLSFAYRSCLWILLSWTTPAKTSSKQKDVFTFAAIELYMKS